MTTDPTAFEVAFRERTGRPWVVLASEPSREAATARMFELMQTRRGGGWHVRPAAPRTPAAPAPPACSTDPDPRRR